MNESRSEGPTDHPGGAGVTRGGLCPSPGVHAGRAVAGTGAKDLLPPRPGGHLGRDGHVPGRVGGHLLLVPEGRAIGPLRGGVGGSGNRGARMPDVQHNGGYMVAAYIVTAVILLGYALSLYRRTNRP